MELTTPQVAAHLKISIETLYSWRQHRGFAFPPRKYCGRRVGPPRLWSSEDIARAEQFKATVPKAGWRLGVRLGPRHKKSPQDRDSWTVLRKNHLILPRFKIPKTILCFQTVATGAAERFLSLSTLGMGTKPIEVAFCNARRQVLAESPIARAILRQERPFARNSAILRPSTIFFGRPRRVPLLRARSSPACTRSLIRTLSCRAMQAKIARTASRNGPMLSKNCSV